MEAVESRSIQRVYCNIVTVVRVLAPFYFSPFAKMLIFGQKSSLCLCRHSGLLRMLNDSALTELVMKTSWLPAARGRGGLPACLSVGPVKRRQSGSIPGLTSVVSDIASGLEVLKKRGRCTFSVLPRPFQ